MNAQRRVERRLGLGGMTMHLSLHGRLRSIPVASLLVGVLLLAGFRLSGMTVTASAHQVGEQPIDLAAMALTPDDLTAVGMTGFGTGVSVLGDVQAVGSFLAAWRADPQGELAGVIAGAAPTRIHLLWLGKPTVAGNPDSSTERFVFSYAFEFADAATAAQGFATLTNGWETGNAHAEPIAATIGQQHAFFRDAGNDPGTGAPYQRADLLFLQGRMVGGVSLEDGVGATPAQEDVVALAQRLDQRIGRVFAGNPPSLSNMIVRLGMPDGFADVLPSDRYEAVDSVAIRRVGETDTELAERQADYDAAGITNYYFVGQPMVGLTADPELLFLNHLRQFGSAEAATTWMQEVIAGLAERGNTDVQSLEPETLGDTVVLTAYRNASGQPTLRADIQQGARVSTLLFRGSTFAEQAVVETVAAAQLACFAQGACLEPVALTSGLADEIEDRRSGAVAWT